MKRAFTLIELLVVIAIIAILAAILFPVFAQAKLAAKGTASLSNVKEINLAAIMYSGDSDDVTVVDGAWNPGPGWMVSYGKGADLSPWTWLTLPYIKSPDIFIDPLSSPHAVDPNLGATITKLYYSEFGYNYSNLSPWDGTNRYPVSLSSINKPSETVMFAGKFNYTYQGSFGWYGPGSFLPVLYNVEPPSCDLAPGYCFFNWGLSGDTVNGMKSMRTEGAYTGGVALRKSGQAIVSWTDGHASSKTPGYLASGTNWTPSINANQLQVTDQSKYLWATNL